MASVNSSNGKATAAAIVVAVQGALIGLSGIAVWMLAIDVRRRFARRFFHDQIARHPGLWGLVLILVAVWLVVITVAIARRHEWVRLAVYITEPILGVAALLRFHPLRSVIGVALAAAAIILVASNQQEGANLGSSSR